MSSIYLDALKDRLYCSAAEWRGRRSAQTVLHQVLLTLCRLCAPVLVHTAEEVWSHIQHKDERVESVHLCHWPRVPDQWLDGGVHERWERTLAVRDDVARAVETLRERKAVANSMEVTLTLWAGDKALRGILQDGRDTVQELLMVSELVVADQKPPEEDLAGMTAGQREPALMIGAVRSDYRKCARCWNRRPSVGQDPDHPELCERCVRAVREQPARP
jgi:isoleucyl-tRNA synthetase